MDPYFIKHISTNVAKFYVNWVKPRAYCTSDLPDNYFEWDKLVEYFDKNAKPSTVGIDNNNIIEEKVRRSKNLANVIIHLGHTSHYDDEKYSKLVKGIIPVNYRNIRYIFCPYDSVYSDENKWDMLVYETGDFFSKHTDGKSEEGHFGTIIIIPPKKINDFTGGDLVVYDGGSKNIINAHPDKWTVVGIPINVEHECTPVTSGRRIVFKKSLKIPVNNEYKLYSESKYEFDENSNHTVEDDGDGDKLESVKQMLETYKSEKEKMKGLIKELKKEKRELKRALTKYCYDPLIDSIEKSPKNVIIIILERKYDTDDPNNLIGEDRRLFRELSQRFSDRIIKLHNLDGEKNMNDDKRDANSPLEPFSRYQFGESIGYYHSDDESASDRTEDIFFQNKDKYSSVPGELVSKGMEYNDQSYDTVYSFKITCIYLIKKN